MSKLLCLASVLLGATQVVAQTWSDCNPMNRTDCTPDVALGTSHTWNFTGSKTASSTVWNTTAGTIDYATDGAEFTINGKGDSPTIQSNFYIFWGQVSVVMKAASGTGIISSIVLESDDLDEIDWEFMGGNNTSVETNYFGKGNTTAYDRAIYYPVTDPQSAWHNYTVLWTKEKLEWIVDGSVVRTLAYADALDGYNYPQTPMTLRLGIWAGGDASENSAGTVEWAGGNTTYADAPYTMTVQSVYVADYSSGSKYTYGNTSGSWESIAVASGNSTIATKLNEVTGLANKFHTLPRWAQITIAAAVAGVGAIAVAALAFCCVRQRRAGRREHAAAAAEWDRHETELAMYKRRAVEDGDLTRPLRGYESRDVSETYEHKAWL